MYLLDFISEDVTFIFGIYYRTGCSNLQRLTEHFSLYELSPQTLFSCNRNCLGTKFEVQGTPKQKKVNVKGQGHILSFLADYDFNQPTNKASL